MEEADHLFVDYIFEITGAESHVLAFAHPIVALLSLVQKRLHFFGAFVSVREYAIDVGSVEFVFPGDIVMVDSTLLDPLLRSATQVLRPFIYALSSSSSGVLTIRATSWVAIRINVRRNGYELGKAPGSIGSRTHRASRERFS